MLFYKNISKVTKTFHGVTFHPGETKAVSGYINNSCFIQVHSMPKEPPKSVEKSKKPATKSTKELQKIEKTDKSLEVAEELNAEQGGILNG